MSAPITPTSSAGSSVTDPTAASSDASSRIPVQTLKENDFLQLLVTQMSNQDPLNPQSDTEFIAQMAQFSALQEAQATQTEMGQVKSGQDVLQANALLGKSVTVQDSSGLTVQGTVSAVQIQAGTPTLTINGQQYALSQVTSIASGATIGTSTLNNYARFSQLGS